MIRINWVDPSFYVHTYSSVPNRCACMFINFEKKIPPSWYYLGLHIYLFWEKVNPLHVYSIPASLLVLVYGYFGIIWDCFGNALEYFRLLCECFENTSVRLRDPFQPCMYNFENKLPPARFYFGLQVYYFKNIFHPACPFCPARLMFLIIFPPACLFRPARLFGTLEYVSGKLLLIHSDG